MFLDCIYEKLKSRRIIKRFRELELNIKEEKLKQKQKTDTTKV